MRLLSLSPLATWSIFAGLLLAATVLLLILLRRSPGGTS